MGLRYMHRRGEHASRESRRYRGDVEGWREMTTSEIADRLKAKKSGNGWFARCPAHDDKNASLSITAANNGNVLVNCHAGCTFSAIAAAAGLQPRDFFVLQKLPRTTKPQIIKTYDYVAANGVLLFQVCRYVPKNFKQRRPDPTAPDGWRWNMTDVSRVLYRLPEVLAAIKDRRTVYVVEGERDADALAALGLCATCNAGGAGKWADGYTVTLTGARVIVILDKDLAGRRHAALVQAALTGKAESVRVVELPDRNDHAVKDAADWIAAGGTTAELDAIIRDAPEWTPPAMEEPIPQTVVSFVKGKPCVLLPNGDQSISATSSKLGELLAKTERFFVRGGAVVKLVKAPDGLPQLDPVEPAALASDFEGVAALRKKDDKDNEIATICSEQTAKLIAKSAPFRDAMLPIHVLTRCPVLIERAGNLIQVSGYDCESGIYAAGAPAEPMEIAEAKRRLSEILAGFRFATLADRARALAAMVTPALVFGGLLKGRAPVDMGEADASQTGKGYRNKLTAALYSQSVKTVTQQKGGVGSMEENFNMALIRGANFIALDNVRGKIDSPGFESFLTEDTYMARVPFMPNVEIDPRRVCVMLTSNKADVTTDLANRSACVRILKQPDGYAFTPYPEGDILEHVRKHQPLYLGAVFAIVRAWHEAGKPRSTETRHDFRPWAQTLDWITRNLLDAGPLLEGHRETQVRMTNPVLNWLRDVALVVVRAQRAGAWLRAGDIVDLIADTGVETPGLSEHADLTDIETRSRVQQATGRKLGLCFKSGDSLTIDGMTFERRKVWDIAIRDTAKEYRITAAAIEGQPIAASPSNAPEMSALTNAENAKNAICGYAAAMAAASPAAIKTFVAANAANTFLQPKHTDTVPNKEGVNIATMGTYSRIAATATTEEDINRAFDLAAADSVDAYETGEI